jgi:hypothetical protein
MKSTYKQRESKRKYNISLDIIIGRRALREAHDARHEWLGSIYDNEPNGEELAKMRANEREYRMGGLIPYIPLSKPWHERLFHYFRQ